MDLTHTVQPIHTYPHSILPLTFAEAVVGNTGNMSEPIDDMATQPTGTPSWPDTDTG